MDINLAGSYYFGAFIFYALPFIYLAN